MGVPVLIFRTLDVIESIEGTVAKIHVLTLN